MSSGPTMRNRRRLAAGSKPLSDETISSIRPSNCSTRGASSIARWVGSSPCERRMNSGSPNRSRSRFRAWLTAEGLSPRWLATSLARRRAISSRKISSSPPSSFLI